MIDFEATRNSLMDKSLDAMIYLGIPEFQKTAENDWKPVVPVNRRDLFASINFLNENFSDSQQVAIDQHWHCMRVGLYSMPIMSYLGIENPGWRKKIFASFFVHDEDKGAFLNELRKTNPTPEDLERISWHASFSQNILRFEDEDVSAIVEQHHYHRDFNRYPKKLFWPQTPERKVLAQILGILDAQDAASTRRNGRTIQDTGKKDYLSPDQVKTAIMRQYGNQQLYYTGNLLAPIDTDGREFIELMYSVGIFKSSFPTEEARLNPFADVKFG